MAQRRTPSGQGPGRGTRDRATGSAGSRSSRARGRGPAAADRPTARPTSRRASAARAGGAKRIRAPKPKGRFTGRAAILALVLSALVLAYAYPVRTYLAQRAEIQRYTEAQRAQEKRIAELEAELAKWEDPEYVRAQARSRLRYIRPDEVPYVVIYSEEAETSEGAGRDKRSQGGRWYEQMWESIATADKAGG